MRNNLKSAIEQLVEEIIETEKVSFRKPLREIGLDSLTYTELLVQIEDNWGLELDYEFAARLKNLNQLIAYLEGKLNDT